MWFFYNLVFISTIILNSIDLSLQSESSTNEDPFARVVRRQRSSSVNKNLPSTPSSSRFPSIAEGSSSFRSSSPARPSLSARPSPPVRPSPPTRPSFTTELPIRDRSRSPTRFMSPPTKIDADNGLQYELDQLEYIQVTSCLNPHREFELKRYTFPFDINIQIFIKRNVYQYVPPEEQIVLSTSNGDVFAILKSSDVLAGIYAPGGGKLGRVRAKINMKTRLVTRLTKDEVAEIPVGDRKRILLYYRVDLLDRHPRQH